MKLMKRIAVLVLAMALVLSLGVAAFADEAATGSITINSAKNVSVATKTFNAYKILDVKAYTANSVVYTVPSELKSFYMKYYDLTGDEADFDAQVVNKIKEEEEEKTDLFAFAAAALAAAKNAGVVPGTATAGTEDTSVTISNLPLGYYVVEDAGTATPISALMLDTTTPAISLTIKADAPSIDKNIDGDNDSDTDNSGMVKYNNAAVGDKVPYVVTSKVPDMTGYEKYYFVVSDTMSKGLTFNKDVAITIGSETLTEDTDYTVTATTNDDGTTAVEIVFKNFVQYQENKGEDITITYSATVNENAVIGVAGNNNEVKLTYSRNPNVTDNNETDKPTSGSPVSETPEAVTRTYVTAVQLTKVDGQGNRLTGAEFQITGTKLNTVLVRTDVYTENKDGTYWKLKDGSYTTDDPNAEGMTQDKYESTTTKYIKTVETKTITKTENVNYTGTVGADGVLRFEGLAAGEYTITEIKAPAGYNLLKDSINIEITWTAPEAPATDCTWAVTDSDAAVDGGIVKLSVVNQAGSELPTTGGMGTTIFYILGSVLVLAAVVLLVTRKRMSRG